LTLYSFNIKITYDDGWYTVQCKELPGAISQGKSIDEAMRNIREAIEGYIEAFPEEFAKVRSKAEVKNKVLEQKTIVEISA
jgi:predicted RNase H-like HicB family nuclease